MANIVELKLNERPPDHARYVMVLGSYQPPARTLRFADHWHGRTYFARDSEANVAAVVKRASKWADAERIANIYVQRAPQSSDDARSSNQANEKRRFR
jgi:hypothetical protein